MTDHPCPRPARRGFTLIEVLAGSTVMLVAVLGALLIYSHSNRVSVEQQPVTEVQNDVRSSMFFISRDIRMAGAGLPEPFAGWFIEGQDNEDQGADVHAHPANALFDSEPLATDGRCAFTVFPINDEPPGTITVDNSDCILVCIGRGPRNTYKRLEIAIEVGS